MNTEQIVRLLQNADFHVLGVDDSYLYLEDPSCILRSFETFFEYAWIVILFITGVFLFGWGISMIRGAKVDYFTNLRSLIIMLCTLSLGMPIVNVIWGDYLFARGCRTIRVSLGEITEILNMRDSELEKFQEFNFYENMEIYDSGAVPYAVAPLATPDVPPDLETVSVSGGAAPKPVKFSVNMSTDSDEDKDKKGQRLDEPWFKKLKPGEFLKQIPNYDSEPVRAYADGKDVVYEHESGRKYKKVNGTRAWRNNNPGNIRYSEFSQNAGAIGQAGGFAVFPSEEIGTRAVFSLLRSDSYVDLTIAAAISRYAPPVENDTAKYHENIKKLTGLSINRLISDLSDTELSTVVNAIRSIEGWGVGDIIDI